MDNNEAGGKTLSGVGSFSREFRQLAQIFPNKIQFVLIGAIRVTSQTIGVHSCSFDSTLSGRPDNPATKPPPPICPLFLSADGRSPRLPSKGDAPAPRSSVRPGSGWGL